MKKFFIAMLMLAALLVLAACGDTTEENIIETTEPVPAPQREHTLEELGEKIVAAGQFWEDWWTLSGLFTTETVEWEEMPEHYVENSPERIALRDRNEARWEEYLARFPENLPDGRAWSILAPTAGFASVNEIRDYLLQIHTEEWVDERVFNEWLPFYEYDGVLFVDGTRAGFSRADWNTAEHTLIEQNGNRVVVETTFLHGAWHRGYDYAYPTRGRYQFIFIDGKLTNGFGSFINFDTEGLTWESLPPTIGQLGRVIESNGRFWESWWNFTWNFSHINWYDWYDEGDRLIARLLPDSGFEDLDGIRHRLSWSYTESWIDQKLSGRDAPFLEHDERLYINFTRPVEYLSRPDWDTATHVLIEQDEDGRHSVVETRVMLSYPLIEEAVYRFTFVDMQIDSGRGAW